MKDDAQTISLSDSDFQQIVQIASKEAGLAIPEGKKSLVQSRVVRRMRALGISDCGTYLAKLKGNATETKNLISALTTNVSHFFREAHHFDFVRDTILRKPTSKLRFWSAGCSNGQEPYSLAMEVLKALPDADKRDVLILATDIDKNVLQKAASGIYTGSETSGIPDAERSKHFKALDGDRFEASSQLKQLIRFRYLNLNGPTWPMKGPFDAIFCRNVVIYFSEATQALLWPRFHTLLKPGGALLLGHSERINPVANSGFESAGVTTYRKLA